MAWLHIEPHHIQNYHQKIRMAIVTITLFPVHKAKNDDNVKRPTEYITQHQET